MEADFASFLRAFSGGRTLSIENEKRREEVFTPVRIRALGAQ